MTSHHSLKTTERCGPFQNTTVREILAGLDIFMSFSYVYEFIRSRGPAVVVVDEKEHGHYYYSTNLGQISCAYLPGLTITLWSHRNSLTIGP